MPNEYLNLERLTELHYILDRRVLIKKLQAFKEAGLINDFVEREDGTFEVAPKIVLDKIKVRILEKQDDSTP